MTETVKIFDTTLRDGEQSPGFSMTIDEKIRLALQLEKLNVDIIEAGFPISSDGDFESVRQVAHAVKRPIVAGLCRVTKMDIDRAWEALHKAKHPRLHLFVATSDIHLEHKLKKTRGQVLEDAIEAVRYARSLCQDVEFSAEDASRTDLVFLAEIMNGVIEAGATTVNIPDTVGYAVPEEWYDFLMGLRERVPRMSEVTLSVHCHNDLGLAVANSLAGIAARARQVECTVNGIGERAGNAAMEEIVMALKVRKDALQADTHIRTEEIYRTSKLLTTITGIAVQPNKAVVGRNAFAHEAGIHQHGVLCNEKTYEIMTPQSIGLAANRLVLGKHSGRHAFAKRIKELGYELSRDDLNEAFKKFKDLADKKKEVFDEDLEAILEEELQNIPETFTLDFFQSTSGTLPTATVRLRKGEELLQDAAIGDGPVHAAFQALERITGVAAGLVEYNTRALTQGKDAVGEVTLRVEYNGQTYGGVASSTDVVEASAKAYLQALNKIVARKKE